MHRSRLTNEFTATLNNFQAAQRQAAEKEKASVRRARAASGGMMVSIVLNIADALYLVYKSCSS